ncbi:hypothetical protein DFQ27_009560 [Actinomortierella ambigua]|uniref:Uncharacterized protein n=1 Tax=Actinomortierella ambigua TaxID=1343610 RepID=A0A9P6PQ49_9FUNG|nr:hypothetical protein DFQ27_009560 [Actinomortierella ambigua]
MRVKVQPVHPKRVLPTSDSDDEPEELAPFAHADDRYPLPNHSRFFGRLSTEPLIEWVLMEGNLDAAENPSAKPAVWEQCADFVTTRLQTLMENDRTLEDKAKKELDIILRKYENHVAAEWARGKVRHLASIVRQTWFFVYHYHKRTSQQGTTTTLDGVDLDEQAERLCPYFAELRDIFDKTATLRINFNHASSLDCGLLEDKDGEDKAKSLVGPSAKKQKVAEENSLTVDTALSDIRSLLAAQQGSMTWASAWQQQEFRLLREELKAEREQHRKERERLEARLDREREALTRRLDKEKEALTMRFDTEKATLTLRFDTEKQALTRRFDKERASYEDRIKALEWQVGAERKLRDDLLVRALAR